MTKANALRVITAKLSVAEEEFHEGPFRYSWLDDAPIDPRLFRYQEMLHMVSRDEEVSIGCTGRSFLEDYIEYPDEIEEHPFVMEKVIAMHSRKGKTPILNYGISMRLFEDIDSKPWYFTDDQKLLKMHRLGSSFRSIANEMRRTFNFIEWRYSVVQSELNSHG